MKSGKRKKGKRMISKWEERKKKRTRMMGRK